MKFSYYTIIGKDVNLIKGHLNNVKLHAGFDRMDCAKELIVVVYKNKSIPEQVTEEILDVCRQNNAKVIVYDESSDNFLDNLYACWNLGYEVSEEGWVFRAGSDQAFNYDSFPKLYDVATRTRENDPKILLNSNTIEHSIRAMSKGNVSRHIVENFGDNFDNFDAKKFEKFCINLNKNVVEELLTVDQSIKYWGKPTTFRSGLGYPHNRTEGCSWLITKEDWRTYGPMVPLSFGWLTGDCHLHDKFETAGYKDYLTRDCITYHFFRGESFNRYT